MTEEHLQESVRKHLQLADRFFRSSKILLNDGDLRSSVDRIYYSMFHAVQAAIDSMKIPPPRSRKGLREVFGRGIIKKGFLNREMGKYLTKAFEMRQASTYKLYSEFGLEGVQELHNNAEEFLRAIKGLIHSNQIPGDKD